MLGSSVFKNEVSVLFFSFFSPICTSFAVDSHVILFLSFMFCGPSFCIYHKHIQVVLSFLGQSYCFSMSSRRYDKYWVPRGGSSGPSLLTLGSNAGPVVFLVSCCSLSKFSYQLLSRFLYNSCLNLFISFLDLMCFVSF